MRLSKLSSMILAVALVTSAVAVQAKITIDMVPVGNAGNNVRNASTSFSGAVSYNYEIAKYETTAGQYCAFLNAVGGTDTYGLYSMYISNTSYGSGISRAGISGNYSYTVAANYDPNKAGGAGYWTYPTKSDAKPGRDLADVSGNNANSYGNPYPIDSGKYTTLVGEFQNSASPYGTYDQCGNVWEWMEAVDTEWFGSGRGLLGGSFYDSTMYQDRTLRVFGRNPTAEYYGDWLNGIGFRVASVPEPSTLALLGTALLGLGVICLRRCRAKA